MLFDVSHSKLSRDYAEAFGIYYDYEALEKIKSIRDKISNNLHKHFVIQSSFDGLLFEDPEKVYFDELKKLRAKINKQYAKGLKNWKSPDEGALLVFVLLLFIELPQSQQKIQLNQIIFNQSQLLLVNVNLS